MSQIKGQTLQENWGISPLEAIRMLDRERLLKLPGKVLLGGFFGLFTGLLLSFLIEAPAHADLSEITQHKVFKDFLSSSAATDSASEEPAVDVPLSRLQVHEQAALSNDYRHRIPAWQKPDRKSSTITVVATAYNNVPAQTDDTPDIAAWGDRIQPGMQLIAVSRDLLKMGLARGMKVRVSGLDGEFIVLDKMNKRYRKRIDIYMGKNIKAARKFGKRNVTLSWQNETDLPDTTLVASR